MKTSQNPKEMSLTEFVNTFLDGNIKHEQLQHIEKLLFDNGGKIILVQTRAQLKRWRPSALQMLIDSIEVNDELPDGLIVVSPQKLRDLPETQQQKPTMIIVDDLENINEDVFERQRRQ